jgi:hypothetical protein
MMFDRALFQMLDFLSDPAKRRMICTTVVDIQKPSTSGRKKSRADLIDRTPFSF